MFFRLPPPTVCANLDWQPQEMNTSPHCSPLPGGRPGHPCSPQICSGQDLIEATSGTRIWRIRGASEAESPGLLPAGPAQASSGKEPGPAPSLPYLGSEVVPPSPTAPPLPCGPAAWPPRDPRPSPSPALALPSPRTPSFPHFTPQPRAAAGAPVLHPVPAPSPPSPASLFLRSCCLSLPEILLRRRPQRTSGGGVCERDSSDRREEGTRKRAPHSCPAVLQRPHAWLRAPGVPTSDILSADQLLPHQTFSVQLSPRPGGPPPSPGPSGCGTSKPLRIPTNSGGLSRFGGGRGQSLGGGGGGLSSRDTAFKKHFMMPPPLKRKLKIKNKDSHSGVGGTVFSRESPP